MQSYKKKNGDKINRKTGEPKGKTSKRVDKRQREHWIRMIRLN